MLLSHLKTKQNQKKKNDSIVPLFFSAIILFLKGLSLPTISGFSPLFLLNPFQRYLPLLQPKLSLNSPVTSLLLDLMDIISVLILLT